MTSVHTETTSPATNPIDLVEEIVLANEWAHDRASDEEMVVEVTGRWCDYRLYFVWQEEISALHFSCGFDMKVPKGRKAAVYELLALVNEKLWLGHFDVASDDNSPAFRHAVTLDLDLRPAVVALAVKPQMMDEAIRHYVRFATRDTVFLSIAAGKTLAYFARHLGDAAAIVRAMPNTPAAIGRGITVACP